MPSLKSKSLTCHVVSCLRRMGLIVTPEPATEGYPTAAATGELRKKRPGKMLLRRQHHLLLSVGNVVYASVCCALNKPYSWTHFDRNRFWILGPENLGKFTVTISHRGPTILRWTIQQNVTKVYSTEPTTCTTVYTALHCTVLLCLAVCTA